MELEAEGKKGTLKANREQGAALTEVDGWIADWSERRQTLRGLIMQRAKDDPAYSWLTAERELLMMDTVIQRLESIMNTLNRPVAPAQQSAEPAGESGTGKGKKASQTESSS